MYYEMRRKDLEVADIADITDIIGRCSVLHLGINDAPAPYIAPYIVPVNFGYIVDGSNITFYFHTADADTRKTRLLAQNPVVSFEAECEVKLIKKRKFLRVHNGLRLRNGGRYNKTHYRR